MDEISLEEAARLLSVPRETVKRWVRQGVVPFMGSQENASFNLQKLEEWARHRNLVVRQHGQKQGEEQPDLIRGISLGGVHSGLAGGMAADMFKRMVALLPMDESQKELRLSLAENLEEREALASTGLGHGLAVPHPRHPQDWGFGAPLVAVFFLERPVDFKAIDGKPVHTLFLIICATVTGHLKMLAQVSHLLNNPDTRAFLATHPDEEALLAHISARKA